MSPQTHPRLRPIEIKRLLQGGRWYFHLRDQLALAGKELLVPQELGPVLLRFDGEHDLAMIRAEALLHGGVSLSPAELLELVEHLDTALLLDGDRFEAAKRAARAAYHAQPFRPPALAGGVYPADPDELEAHLGVYDLRATAAIADSAAVAGVLSPHIDYARGGFVYAQGWRQAGEAARSATQVIVLGTDHYGSAGRLTLSRQRYATPWGVFAADPELERALESALGAETAYAEELHHRTEHSVELAAVWLHHLRRGEPVRLLPILCGHSGPFLAGGIPGNDTGLAAAIELLRQAVADGALVVVAGDLAHVGPVFGDPLPFGPIERSAVRAADMALVAACSFGAGAALTAVAELEDRYRICGLSPPALDCSQPGGGASLQCGGVYAAGRSNNARSCWMAYEFGFDVVRIEVDEVEIDPGEEREFEIEAFSGDVSAHIAASEGAMQDLLRAIDSAAQDPMARPGGPWEPQLPQMRGFIFHPRIFLEHSEAHPPTSDAEDEIDFWELILDDEDGSRLMLRTSEPTLRAFQRRIADVLFSA